MDEIEDALINAHRAAMARYAYFLLAAAVVAIGYALGQTRYAELTPSEIPLALAVLCWFASFYYGCQHVENHFNTLRLTALLPPGAGWQHPRTPKPSCPRPKPLKRRCGGPTAACCRPAACSSGC